MSKKHDISAASAPQATNTNTIETTASPTDEPAGTHTNTATATIIDTTIALETDTGTIAITNTMTATRIATMTVTRTATRTVTRTATVTMTYNVIATQTAVAVPVYQTKWGSYGSGNGQFNFPTGIAVIGNSVYVCDFYNNRVQRFSNTGNYEMSWSHTLVQPRGIDGYVGIDHVVYVSDQQNVKRYFVSGTNVSYNNEMSDNVLSNNSWQETLAVISGATR